MRKPFILWTVLFFSATGQSFAQDSVSHKNPWLISGSAGYTINKGFGSLLDKDKEFNAMFGIKDATQKNWGGFELKVGLQKQLNQYVYFKTGLSYLQKQVNPEEGGYNLYKDSLKTGYLTIPFLGGIIVPVNPARTILFSLEGGASANFRLIDNTKHAIDEVSFSTSSVTLALQGGCGLTIDLHSGSRAFVQYSYMVDLTDAYGITLYWGAPGQTYRSFDMKFRTQVISLGWQWQL